MNTEQFKTLVNTRGHVVVDTIPVSTIIVSCPYFMERIWYFFDDIIFTFSAFTYNVGYIEGSLNSHLGEARGAIVGVEGGNLALWVYPCYDLLIITLLYAFKGWYSCPKYNQNAIGYKHW